MTAFTIGRRKGFKRCEMSPSESEKVQTAVRKLPGAMAGELTNLNFERLKGTRLRNVYKLKVPPFRLIYQVFGRQIVMLELDRRDDNTYKHLDRLIYRRLGDGVEIVEVADKAAHETSRPRSGKAPARRARPVEYANPLMPFSASMLAEMGADADTIAVIRGMRESIDIAAELAERGGSADVVELLADAWFDPARYLAMFDKGRVPTVADARLAEEEIERRLASGASTASVAQIHEDDLEIALTGTIDEWMFYLHPLQIRVAHHQPTGPSRARGGPGSGKTVAALHRAKFLVRDGHADSVLLTTFVRVLPATWRRLLAQFAPEQADAITTSTVDAIARQIVVGVEQLPALLTTDQERLPLAERAKSHAGLTRTAQWLLTEFDTVIAGRGLAKDGYIALMRTGRGSAVSPEERERVWAAYEHYTNALVKQGATDFAHLRLRALELARQGHGPRYDAIIIDEAQDLTESHIQLLTAVDRHDDHRCFMLVGDGQQAIYPGGFSLRSVGLDVRGRSFVLQTNWRNTQRISDTAIRVLGGQDVRDLEDDAGVMRDDAPPRRLGADPELHLVASEHATDEVLSTVLGEALKSHAPEEIAVLARTNKIVKRHGEQVCRQLRANAVQLSDLPRRLDGAPGAVRLGTFEYSKGMEFKVVLLVAPRKRDWTVPPFWLTEPDDQREWWRTERRKLFVAMTRARDRLVVVTSEPLAAMVEDARDGFDVWPWD